MIVGFVFEPTKLFSLLFAVNACFFSTLTFKTILCLVFEYCFLETEERGLLFNPFKTF